MKKRIKRKQQISFSSTNLVPHKYSEYLYDLNAIYSRVDSSVILGRDKEIDRIFNCFLKSKQTNVVLLGNHGVGKTATVQKLVDRVIHGDCPVQLADHHFFYLDAEAILTKMDSDKFLKKLDSMIKFIANYSNLVIVIEQIHLMEADYRLSYYLGLLVKQSHVKVLGLTTYENFYDFFEFNTKVRSRLEIIQIEEPKPNKVYPMIVNIVKRLKKLHKVNISKDMINYIISVSAAFCSEICNPELTVTIIEKSMVFAKRKGQKEVTKNIVNQNFNFDYELYEKMSKEDKEITAYHEAGHFIVQKMSDNIKNYHTTAITIVPSEDFLGVTLFEEVYLIITAGLSSIINIAQNQSFVQKETGEKIYVYKITSILLFSALFNI